MQIRNSSDWRDGLPFDLAIPAADAVPGEATRCSGCGPDSEPWPREALWVLKHRHPTNPAGYVRFYCAEHRPAPAFVPPVPERARRAPRSSATPRKAAAPIIPPRVAAVCPDCFVEVAATGICGVCGERVG